MLPANAVGVQTKVPQVRAEELDVCEVPERIREETRVQHAAMPCLKGHGSEQGRV